MEFEWDETKERENIDKHGFSFLRATEAFRDPYGVKLADSTHSEKENRFFWVGKDSKGLILTIRFTLREQKIRIIGCGSWRKYRKYYEEALKKRESKN